MVESQAGALPVDITFTPLVSGAIDGGLLSPGLPMMFTLLGAGDKQTVPRAEHVELTTADLQV